MEQKKNQEEYIKAFDCDNTLHPNSSSYIITYHVLLGTYNILEEMEMSYNTETKDIEIPLFLYIDETNEEKLNKIQDKIKRTTEDGTKHYFQKAMRTKKEQLTMKLSIFLKLLSDFYIRSKNKIENYEPEQEIKYTDIFKEEIKALNDILKDCNSKKNISEKNKGDISFHIEEIKNKLLSYHEKKDEKKDEEKDEGKDEGKEEEEEEERERVKCNFNQLFDNIVPIKDITEKDDVIILCSDALYNFPSYTSLKYIEKLLNVYPNIQDIIVVGPNMSNLFFFHKTKNEKGEVEVKCTEVKQYYNDKNDKELKYKINRLYILKKKRLSEDLFDDKFIPKTRIRKINDRLQNKNIKLYDNESNKFEEYNLCAKIDEMEFHMKNRPIMKIDPQKKKIICYFNIKQKPYMIEVLEKFTEMKEFITFTEEPQQNYSYNIDHYYLAGQHCIQEDYRYTGDHVSIDDFVESYLHKEYKKLIFKGYFKGDYFRYNNNTKENKEAKIKEIIIQHIKEAYNEAVIQKKMNSEVFFSLSKFAHKAAYKLKGFSNISYQTLIEKTKEQIAKQKNYTSLLKKSDDIETISQISQKMSAKIQRDMKKNGIYTINPEPSSSVCKSIIDDEFDNPIGGLRYPKIESYIICDYINEVKAEKEKEKKLLMNKSQINSLNNKVEKEFKK